MSPFMLNIYYFMGCLHLLKYVRNVQKASSAIQRFLVGFLLLGFFSVSVLALLEFPAPGCKTIDNTT